MQIHTPTMPIRETGDFKVYLNRQGALGPFAVIQLNDGGTIAMFIENIGDADRLIRAAIAAKDLLIEATGAQVRFPASLPPELADQDEPEPPDFSDAAALAIAEDAVAIIAESIRTGATVVVTFDEDEDGPCPSVSPWNYRCVMTIAEHEADPRIAHHDGNGDTWFDRGASEDEDAPGHVQQVAEHLARQESRA